MRAAQFFQFRTLAILWLLFVLVAALSSAVGWYPWMPNPNAPDLDARLVPPGTPGHLVGTDPLGRDLFARIWSGALPLVIVAVGGAGVSMLLGMLIGASAGWRGGWIDAVLMRFTDAVLAFPALVLVLTVIAMLGPGLWQVVIVIGCVAWTAPARLVRAEVLSWKQRTFITAAKASGCDGSRIFLRHLLPNVATTVRTQLLLLAPDVVMVEAALGYLGLGAQPPQASWGNLIAAGQPYLLDGWWVVLFPGACLFLTVLALYVAAGGSSTRCATRKIELARPVEASTSTKAP